MLTTLTKLRIAATIFALTPFQVVALDLPALAGPVVLTITDDASPSQQTEFDLGRLEAMGPDSFETSTIWTEGVQTFKGVRLSTLLTALGVNEGEITATAINDYSITIPVSDAIETGPLVAFEMNGLPMSVREKGPLWIVYPYDSNPSYQSDVIFARSIWQLDRIHLPH